MNYYSSIALAALLSKVAAVEYITTEPSDPIARYYPVTDVRDHANIDMDQGIINTVLADTVKWKDAFESVKKIYEEGGHSKSVVTIKITDKKGSSQGLEESLDKGTVLTGLTISGDTFRGSVYADYSKGDTEIKMKYEPQKCYEGGLTGTYKDSLNCLAPTNFEEGGAAVLTDGGNEIFYQGTTNTNERTLQGFSTGAPSKMEGERNAKYFADYYGSYDFADDWVQSALSGGETSFDNGNADFSDYSEIGRIECIKKATAYTITLVYAMHEFERAVPLCNAEAPYADTDALHAWDEGVAFYSGSNEGKDGNGKGYLTHALAEKRCANFGTCGPNGGETTGIAQVNYKLVELFNEGKEAIGAGRCADAQIALNGILKQIYIPLIQGTLRYAAKLGLKDTQEKGQAEGAVFALGILPRLHAVKPDAAAIVYDQMKVMKGDKDGNYPTDFKKVKEAFESAYNKLGIDCSMIGGYMNDGNGYYTPDRGYDIDSTPCSTACGDKADKTHPFGADGGTQSCYELSTYDEASRDAVCALSTTTCRFTCLGQCGCGDVLGKKFTQKNGKKKACSWLTNKPLKQLKVQCKPNKSNAAVICPNTCKGFCGWKGA